MGCPCENNSTTPFASVANVKKAANQVTDCTVTKEQIETWLNLLQTAKKNGSSVSEQLLNSNIGIMQSALNYPNNYCYYQQRIDIFKEFVLPKLMNEADSGQ